MKIIPTVPTPPELGMEVPSHLPGSSRTYAHSGLIPSRLGPPKPKVSSCTSLPWLGRRWHPHHLKLTDSLHVSCPYGPFPPTWIAPVPRATCMLGRPQEAIESLQLISRFNGTDLAVILKDVEDHRSPPLDESTANSITTPPDLFSSPSRAVII